ncbi:MAG: hypothetical protein K8H88_32365, partial [Sandaracinaceae bacterium]|nr:hypothetical protein [Sandaracinaceae bacterium]
LGLWDAWELSLALSGAISVEQGLARYSRGRRAHLGYYQWATRVLTPFFQSDAAPLGWLRGLLRDAAMGLACKLPYVRTRMIRTMCGLDRGVLFAGALPMPRAPRLLTSESAD